MEFKVFKNENNKILKEYWLTPSEWDALDKTTVQDGDIYHIVGTIDKGDLSADVNASLAKADSSLQKPTATLAKESFVKVGIDGTEKFDESAYVVAPSTDGTVGQVLKKTANGTEWANDSGGGGGAELEAKLNENIIKNPDKTYLVWKGASFPNSTNATFKAPAGCVIDWGDGTVETFETASTEVNTHTYTDGFEYHLISLSNYTLVGESAFWNCIGLTSVTIGNGVTSIGANAFSGCTQLTNVTISDSVKSIESNAFDGCTKLTNVTIPDSVTSIGDSAFYYCSGLTSVIIGNGVTSIGNGAFESCSGLTNITIPSSVTSMGERAFESCSGLTSVTIPDSVKNIKDYTFWNCNKLKTIRILSATNPPTLGSNAFETSLEKIIVPKSAINAYKSASGWSTYADKIVYEVDSSDLSGGGGGTNVVANPGTGTTRITDIQIGSTKYFILPAKYEQYLKDVTFVEPTVTLGVSIITSPVKDGKFLYNQPIPVDISHIEVKNDATSLNNLTLYWRGSSIQSNISPSINDTTTIISSGSYKLSTSNNRFELELPYVVDGESRSVSSYKDIPSGYALWYGAGEAATRLDTTNIKNIVSSGSVNISVETTASQKITIMFPGTVTAKTNASFSTNIPLTKTGTVSLPVYDGSSGTTILADAVTYNIYQTEPLKAGTNDIILTLGGN